MSIQFLCVSCREPIEVDDQWAMKVVECPYCHGQVTAPGTSTYQGEQPVVAREVGSAEALAQPSPSVTDVRQVSGAGVISVVALILACLALVLMVVCIGVGATHVMDVIESLSPTADSQAQAEAVKAIELRFQKAAENRETWVVVFSVSMLGGFVFWVAAVICGLLGLSQPKRRGFAVGALVLAAIPLGFILLGTVLG